jgi:hypothetical protein
MKWTEVDPWTAFAVVPGGLLFRGVIHGVIEAAASSVSLAFVPCAQDVRAAWLIHNVPPPDEAPG